MNTMDGADQKIDGTLSSYLTIKGSYANASGVLLVTLGSFHGSKTCVKPSTPGFIRESKNMYSLQALHTFCE